MGKKVDMSQHPVVPYDGSHDPVTGTGTVRSDLVHAGPSIPKFSGGSGKVAVQSEAMKSVASRVDTLLENVREAKRMLDATAPVATGAFPQALDLKKSTADAVQQYSKVLDGCLTALLGFKEGLMRGSVIYENAAHQALDVSDLFNRAVAGMQVMADASKGSASSGGQAGASDAGVAA